MMTEGALPVENIFGKISFASLPESSPFPISRTNSPRCSALIGDSAISLFSAFSAPAKSPITQLAAVLRIAAFGGHLFVVLAERARLRQHLRIVLPQPRSRMNRSRRDAGNSGISF